MRMSNQGLAELAGHEGIVTSRYRDSVGVWTIGVGHTAAAGSPDPAATKAEWEVDDLLDLFRRDVQSYEREVLRAVKVPLTQTQFDALVSFHYNTGGISRAKLTQALNRGDYAGAAAGFMGWLKPAEIRGRREKEQRLFRDGVYSNGGMATVWSATPGGSVEWSKGERVNVLALLGVEQVDLPTAPPQPAAIGHNGGPAMSTATPPTVPNHGSPVEKAIGAGKGAAQGAAGGLTTSAAIIVLLDQFGALPASADNALVGMAITGVLTGFSAFVLAVVQAYRAPKNAEGSA